MYFTVLSRAGDLQTTKHITVYLLIIAIFILGYIAIAFEHTIRVNKTASALLTGVLCWMLYMMGSADKDGVSEQLYEHLGQISGILFSCWVP